METLNKLKEKYSLYFIAQELRANYTTVWRWVNRGYEISPKYKKALRALEKKLEKRA